MYMTILIVKFILFKKCQVCLFAEKFNSRSSNLDDYIAGVDSVPVRHVIDYKSNKYGDIFCEFLSSVKAQVSYCHTVRPSIRRRLSLKPLNGIQRNLTGCKISTASTRFVFFGPVGKKDGRPGLLLAETFLTSSLKPMNRIQRNLTGSKISMSSTKFVFFGSI